jgi:hypothetical protein
MLPFLVGLGVRTEPTVAQIAEVFRSGVSSPPVALGLAGLLRVLHQRSPSIANELPLSSSPWILDGHGNLCRPADLFRWTHETESLIGDAPELYIDHEMESRLGSALADALGFKALADVRVDDVVRHIDIVSNTGGTVPFRAYLWMEQGLADGWLDPDALVSQLARKSWVTTDDGELADCRRVLGTRALHLFGQRRGYWQRGAERCARLCGLFGIPGEVTVETVKEFLTEIAGEVERDGDAAVLGKEPALPRMLLACYAFLGRAKGRPRASAVFRAAHGRERRERARGPEPASSRGQRSVALPLGHTDSRGPLRGSRRDLSRRARSRGRARGGRGLPRCHERPAAAGGLHGRGRCGLRRGRDRARQREHREAARRAPVSRAGPAAGEARARAARG